MTIAQQREEYIMSDLSVIRSTGRGEQVKRDAQSFPAINELLVVLSRQLLWCSTFLFGTYSNRGPVLVAARNHQYSVSLKPMVTGKNIGRQISTRDVTQV
jgi:hypothetical protein